MKLIIVSLLILVTIAAAIPVPEEITVDDAEWEAFKKTHEKVYADITEEQKRRDNYLATKKFIAEHNKKFVAGEVTYEVGINSFADLTHDEFKKNVLMKKPSLEEVTKTASSS